MDMSNGGRITTAGARTGHTHPAAEIDALPLTAFNVKGDLIVASGNDAYYVLPAGADGTALLASSTSPSGLAYGAPAPAAHTHTQSESHSSADTDVATTSLHHTLGTGANQAAAGNHGHTDIVPIGAIFPYAGTTAPANYLICDGSTQSAAAYPGLATVCGSIYGTAPAGYFRLPNLQARVPFGRSGSSPFANVGDTGGATSVTLAEANMPTHAHSIAAHNHATTNHNHTVTAHTHSTPNHQHAPTIDKPGNHGHSVSVTAADHAQHNHDNKSRVNATVSNAKAAYSSGDLSNVMTWAGVATSNFTANEPKFTHTTTVTQTNAGDHSHTLTWTDGGGGTTGNGNDTIGEGTVTVQNNTAPTVTGNAGAASPTAISVLDPYLTLHYIIKAK